MLWGQSKHDFLSVLHAVFQVAIVVGLFTYEPYLFDTHVMWMHGALNLLSWATWDRAAMHGESPEGPPLLSRSRIMNTRQNDKEGQNL